MSQLFMFHNDELVNVIAETDGKPVAGDEVGCYPEDVEKLSQLLYPSGLTLEKQPDLETVYTVVLL